MSGQSKINFLDKQEEIKEVEKIEEIKESADVRAKKLSNKDDGYKNSNYISSAVTNVVTDIGGPTKQIKFDSSNSIWDNEKLTRFAEEIDSKTKTQNDKEQIETNKRNAEKERMDTLAEEVQNNLNKKCIIYSILHRNTK